MYEALDHLTLKTGEDVELGVVKGPDPDWAPRLEGLLAHKGDYWKWGNEQVLRHERGIDAFYYILHRQGEAFANIMTIEYQGVGILGHVYTKPEDRRKGAASALMHRLMDHFHGRGGRALSLGTGYDSPAYHIYSRFGFRSVEPRSGCMSHYTDSEECFESDYFAPSPVEATPLNWPHWPASSPLFLGNWPGIVRCLPFGLTGRQSTEGPALTRLEAESEGRDAGESPPRTAAVLQNRQSGAVVGLAATGPDPLWPGTHLLDVYCHPDFWGSADSLIGCLEPQSARRWLAYTDSACQAKPDVLSDAGFRRVGTLPEHLPADRDHTGYLDVDLWQRS